MMSNPTDPKNRPARLFSIADLWRSEDHREWSEALDLYWNAGLLKDENVALEREMDTLDRAAVESMSEEAWFDFLINRYYLWKYTAPNRYATTTMWLKKQVEHRGTAHLASVKDKMFRLAPVDLRAALQLVAGRDGIAGLGPAGASGLLAVLWPERFGTGDQFVVKALLEVPELPEREALLVMDPESLTIDETLILIGIFTRKAEALNTANGIRFWTPRRIDMVLWTVGHWA